MIEKIQSVYREIKFLASKKKRAFYIGWVGHGNLGDEALYMAIKNLFGRHIEFYEKNYVGTGLKYYLNNLNLPLDYVFLGGGTLINRGKNYSLLKSIYAKKKIVFGTGVANPEYWQTVDGFNSYASEWAEALNNTNYIGVRGPLSKKLLTEWGVAREIKIIGDPALLFLRDAIVRKKKNRILGVNVGFTGGLLWGGDDEAFLNKLVDELRVIGDRGWSFKFFPVYKKDIEITYKMMKLLKEYKVECVENYMDIDKFMDEMDNIDVFIGEKLHSVVLAICTHTPSMMLEYRPKCRDFMMSMDLNHLNVRTDQINRNQLVEIVEKLYDNLESEQDIIHEKAIVIKNKLIEEAKFIIQAAQ
jgi:polysaccharide pyruvyl transferase WcaK-like protein